MHLSTVETVLEHKVLSPAHLCFTIEAAHWPTVRGISRARSFTISGGVQPHAYVPTGAAATASCASTPCPARCA